MQYIPPFYEISYGKSPLVASAIHNGHTVRDNISMILIPSLTCPGEVWEETVAPYKK